MNSYLPSKKFIKFFGIVFAIGIIILIFSFIFSKKTVYENKDKNKNLVTEDYGGIYTLDTDGDGIYDWEEALWGTDSKDIDTDKDGISDGEEIEKNKKEIIEKNNITQEDLDNEELNQTEVFARQFLSVVALTNESGGLTSESVQEFSKSFDRAVSDSTIPDPFTLANIKLSGISAAQYKKNLETAFVPFAENRISELEIFSDLLNKDPLAVEKLEKSVKLYSDLSNKLLLMQAPHAAAGIHLSLINNASKISVSLINMKDVIENPLQSMIGFGQYSRYSTEFEKNLESLQKYFISNGII